jgi:hypothetical protein
MSAGLPDELDPPDARQSGVIPLLRYRLDISRAGTRWLVVVQFRERGKTAPIARVLGSFSFVSCACRTAEELFGPSRAALTTTDARSLFAADFHLRWDRCRATGHLGHLAIRSFDK